MPKVLLAAAGAGAGAAGCCRGGEKSLGGGAGFGSKKLPPLSELFWVEWPVGEARLENDEAVGRGGDCMPPNKSAFKCDLGAAACGLGAALVGGGDCMPPKTLLLACCCTGEVIGGDCIPPKRSRFDDCGFGGAALAEVMPAKGSLLAAECVGGGGDCMPPKKSMLDEGCCLC